MGTESSHTVDTELPLLTVVRDCMIDDCKEELLSWSCALCAVVVGFVEVGVVLCDQNQTIEFVEKSNT